MTALYEIKGVNVVDTPPQRIAEEFRRHGADGEEAINWVELYEQAKQFDPNATFEAELNQMLQKVQKAGKRSETWWGTGRRIC